MSANWMAALQALAGGVLIGLASWLLLASLGRVAGISGIVANSLVRNSGEESASGVWRWMFIAGLVLGGGAMSLVMPSGAIGQANASSAVLIVAGLTVGIGTVIGSGCTSGHGVCGLGRRSMRSLVSVLVFMAVGMLTASLMQAWK